VSPALDTLLRAETPEGIELALRPAGVVARVLAYAVDFGIRLLVFLFAANAVEHFGRLGGAVLALLAFALEWLYPVLFELSLGGATPGKKLLGLRVVMDSGLPVTPAASLTRNLLRAADFLPFLYAGGLLAMLLRADFKRGGDLAAGTLVVHVREVTLHAALPPAPPAAPARPLDAAQQAAVIAWGHRRARLTPARAEELAQLASPAWRPAAEPAVAGGEASGPLLSIAHWLLGRRPASTS
jgi:uncharacterized RDD family membrane protein YckC